MKRVFQAGIVMFLSVLALPAGAQAAPPPADALAKVAADLCMRPELYGYTMNAQGGVEGQISLPLFAKRLAALGVDAQVKASAANWKGIPQSQIAASISDYRQCAQNMMKILLEAYARPERNLVHRAHRNHLRASSTQSPQAPVSNQTIINNCSVTGGTITGTYAPTCSHPPKED